MILYLIRHGIAENSAPGGDPDRRLTQQGTFRTAMVAKGLKRLGIELDRIVSSPYVRARQTAEIIARILNYEEEIHFDRRLVPMARFEEASDMLAENDDAGSMLVTGHMPSMGEIISGLVSRGELTLEVKKASVTAVEINGFRPQARGTLLWTLPPKVFENLTK